MAEVQLSATSQPPDPCRGAPRIAVYDPSRSIRNPTRQLRSFGSLVEIYYHIEDLVPQIKSSQVNQLFLLLIFPTETDVEVKRFLMKYIPHQAHLSALYLIFPNGLQFHEQWIDTEAMPKLRWCRSFTTQLIRDILDICKTACDQSITFYQQRQIQAEDAIERGTNDSAESIPILCAQKVTDFSLLLSRYLTLHDESDD